MWQPISTAPRDGTRVWLYCPEEDNGGEPHGPLQTSGYWGEAMFRYEAWFSDVTGWRLYREPSHWMPLPPPPGGPPYQSEPAMTQLASVFPKDSIAARAIQNLYICKRGRGLSAEDAYNECLTELIDMMNKTKEGE